MHLWVTDQCIAEVLAVLHGEGGLLTGGFYCHSIAAACTILVPVHTMVETSWCLLRQQLCANLDVMLKGTHIMSALTISLVSCAHDWR